MLLEMDNLHGAEENFLEALHLWEMMDCPFQEADQHHSLARTYMLMGEWANVREHACQAATGWVLDNNSGGLCCSLAMVAAVLEHDGETSKARETMSFLQEFKNHHQLVLVPQELKFQAELISRLGPGGHHHLPLTLEAAHSLFDQIR